MPGISYAAAGALSGFVVQIYANSLRRIPALRRMPPRPARFAAPSLPFLHPSPPSPYHSSARRSWVGAAPSNQRTGRRNGGLCVALRALAQTGSISSAPCRPIRPHAVAARLRGQESTCASGNRPPRARARPGACAWGAARSLWPAHSANAGKIDRRVDGRLT